MGDKKEEIMKFDAVQLKNRIQETVQASFGMLIPDEQWKALVEKHGEDKAYQIYANNEYEVPSVEKDRPKTITQLCSDTEYKYHQIVSCLQILQKSKRVCKIRQREVTYFGLTIEEREKGG